MRAFLLAAGLGKRLRPITDRIPKCLAPINGEPLLHIWLRLLRQHGVERVLLNTHYLARQVEEFLLNWAGPPQVMLSYEEKLLGSAGTLLRNWSFVEQERDFLVCYADNLTDMDLTRLVAAHRRHGSHITMATFRPLRANECGVVEMLEDGVVTGFEEKPAVPKSPYANAGVYVMNRSVGPLLPAKVPADIASDLLPSCLGSLRAWQWDGELIDVGTPEAYERAQARWRSRKNGCQESV
ncbi:MAG: nucleotidyltransferase family protein [Bryobacterales bacterium]|nr:nucleotidyltransferase family protein [Bryobacterales bacterium]